MLSKLRPHLLLALVFLVLTLCQQYLFYAFKGYPIILLSMGKYFGLYVFFFLCTLIQGKKARFFFLILTIFLAAWQFGHLSYFGTQVLPTEIYLMLIETTEIQGVLMQELSHVYVPILFLIVPMGIGWWANKKTNLKLHIPYLAILFTLYLIYNPVRTYLTGNTWGRQPSTRELAGMNVYLTLSYFFGKILPYKLSHAASVEDKNSSLDLVLKQTLKPQWDNIVVVLGESLTPYHMNLFGYPKPTTPFLSSLKDDKNFFFTKGISSGVSTDVSVAFFLNLGFGAAGSVKASKGDHCLFKLAKTQEYRTHFLSIQSDDQLRYILPFLCTAFMDDSRSMEKLAPEVLNHHAASDEKLLPHLKNILGEPGKHFIMLHQRGSHAPWNLRFSELARIFKPTEGEDERISDYDNSVFEFDLFFKELFKILSVVKGKTLLLYLSDHGESLGEEGRWGHGSLIPRAFEVPMLVSSFNQTLPAGTRDLPPFLPQYNFSLYLARELGYQSNQDSHKPVSDFVIYGNDIDGFAGKAEIKFDEKGNYTYKVKP